MAVFGVKYRLGLISPKWQNELHAVMGRILNEIQGVKVIKVGGVADHVHVFFSTRGIVPEEEIVRKVKSESTLWVNNNRLAVGRFAWQSGGGRFSYSPSAVPQVKHYIENQAEHHRRMSFAEEYARFLAHYNFPYTKYDLPDPLADAE